MDLGFPSTTQASSTARDPQQPVATALICSSMLLSAGISSILSGTPFDIQSGAAPRASMGRSQSDPGIDLCLICENPTPDGYAATVEMLKAQHPSARIVVLADHMEPTALAQALQAGLNGFCLTAMPREALVKALELIMLGEIFVPADLVFATIGGAVRDRQFQPGLPAVLVPANDGAAVATSNKLSGREAQILHCLTQGASNKLIARELGLAEATVKVHVKAILRKTKAGNRTQAAIWASEHLNAQPVAPSAGQPLTRTPNEIMTSTSEAGALAYRRVLIVEDEYFLANDMAQAFREVGVDVVGPAPSTNAALALLEEEPVDAAVLDISLIGHRVFPVADALRKQGVPFIFATGLDAASVPEAYKDIPRWGKPFRPKDLARALPDLIQTS